MAAPGTPIFSISPSPSSSSTFRIPKEESFWDFFVRFSDMSIEAIGDDLIMTYKPNEIIGFPTRVMSVPASFYNWILDSFFDQTEEEEKSLIPKVGNGKRKSRRLRSEKSRSTKNETENGECCLLAIPRVFRRIKMVKDSRVWIPIAELVVHQSMLFLYDQLLL